MSRGQTLRALVTERLTAAAEDIFALVERTIAEYEEELRRSKEENQRKQQLLDEVLPQQEVLIHDFQVLQNHETPETPQIKEEPKEQSVKQEEEQLPQFTDTPRNTDNITISNVSSLCDFGEKHCHSAEPQTMKEFTEKGLLKSHLKTCTETTSTSSLIKTEADEDHYNRVLISNTNIAAKNSTLFTKYRPAPETSATVTDGHTVWPVRGEKHECPFCTKTFMSKQTLEMHVRFHTCEKPFSCSICKRTFARKDHLDVHSGTHTGEGPYSCSVATSGGSSSVTGSTVSYNVQYQGKKTHINLNGVSYSSFLAEARERFGIHSDTNVYLTDDTETQVDEDVFTELIEEKPNITLVVVDAPSVPESAALFPCMDVLPLPSHSYESDVCFTPPKRLRSDDSALEPKQCFNAWNRHRGDQEKAMPLPRFQAAVRTSVTSAGRPLSSPQAAGTPPQRKRTSCRVPPDVRKDGADHFPAWESRQRCKHCTGDRFTHVYCRKCKVHLCLNKGRNCFQAYHLAE